jgi:hypothetical protein
MQSISLQNHGAVTCMISVNCFQKCGFNLNWTNDVDNQGELSIPKDNCGQLKAYVSFQEYVFIDNNVTWSAHCKTNKGCIVYMCVEDEGVEDGGETS